MEQAGGISELQSLWAFGGLSFKELAKRVWKEVSEDALFGRAAELSYYFLLALFPLLIFLTSVIGIILGSGTGTRHALFSYLARVVPPAAFQLIDSTMYEISATSSGSKLSLGLLAALWAASNGMGAITQSLNVAYDVTESRPWWKQRLVAVSLTIGLSTIIILALTLVLTGGRIADSLAHNYELGSLFPIAWKIVQWPIVIATMLFAFALIYYFGPDLREQSWVWITPGSVIGVALWLGISLGFRIYLQFFDSYSKTYGSLGAVIILMLWFYFTGLAILVGSEVNSEIENAAAKRGAPEAKDKGEKSPQEGSETKAA